MKIFLSVLLLIFNMLMPAMAQENPATPAPADEKVAEPAAAANESTPAEVAQEAIEEQQAPLEESEGPMDLETDYTFGTVTKISAQEITIREFDDEKGEEVEMTYQIAPEVEWENVTSWEGAAAGDYAEIDYTIEADGKRVASFIAIESMKEEEAKV